MSTSVPPPNMPKPVAAAVPPPPAPKHNRRVTLLVSLVLAAAVAALGLTVLGGGNSSRITDPVAQAATISSDAGGYRMKFSIEISSSSGMSPVTGSGSGVFDAHDRTGSLTLTMNLGNEPQVIQALGSNNLVMQEIIDGTTVYMKMPAALSTMLPTSGKPWIELNLAKLSGVPGLSALGSNPISSDPSQMLQWLRAVSDSVVADGHQRVDGVETTRYRAGIDLDRVVDRLPALDKAVAQQALSALEQAMPVHQIPVEVWVDAQHLVRRIAMTVSMTASGQTVDENMTIDISHYGPQPKPALPPSDQVTDLSSLLGSLGG
jgi:hypothetical protein